MKWNNRIYKRAVSRRLANWDYNGTGKYFVTINVLKGMECLAMISEKGYALTQDGFLLEETLLQLPYQFSNAELGSFIIMPNHIHMLIGIKEEKVELPVDVNGGFAGKENPMFYKGLARVVRWLKGRSTFEIRKLNPEFSWQKNYYERQISSGVQEKIALYYMKKNPERWLKKHRK